MTRLSEQQLRRLIQGGETNTVELKAGNWAIVAEQCSGIRQGLVYSSEVITTLRASPGFATS